MDQDKAILLAEALESGEYEQGFLALQRSINGHERYCCLGVACRVAMRNGVEVVMVTAPDGEHMTVTTFDDCTSTVPSSVKEFFGFKSDYGAFLDEDGHHLPIEGSRSLMELNDGRKNTFADIARSIRKNYELL